MIQNKTAVFGSAFNPPHLGHADVIDQALEVFDRVIVVPSYSHAFGKAMAAYSLRLELAETLIGLHPGWQQRVIVSDIEQTIAEKKADKEPIYTFDVLNELEAQLPKSHLVFVVGPDNAALDTWAKFYKAKEIDERWGRWDAKERVCVRSTAIREIINSGGQPKSSDCPPEIVTVYRRYIKPGKSI
jgi:nicotinate-nucleotide adenylyltransferase